MRDWKRQSLLAATLLISLCGIAQSNDAINKGDVMRSEGKIYVVMAVVITILAGLILFVVRLDRKMARMEKERG